MTETWSKRRCLVKLLVDHMTFSSFISRFNIDWTDTVLQIFSINDSYLSAAPAEMFNFDCALSHITTSQNKLQLNSILVSLSPVYYGVFNIILIYFYKCLKSFFLLFKMKIEKIRLLQRKKGGSFSKPVIQINFMRSQQEQAKSKKEPEMTFDQIVFATCLIIFYNFYPRLLQNGMEWLKCIELTDDHISFLESDPDIPCWGEKHWFSIVATAMPTLLLWGLLTPILLHYLVYKIKTKVYDEHSTTKRQLLEFRCIDYKPQFYFWDLISYISKFTIVFCAVITNKFDPASQAAILILVMLGIFLIQEKLKPYKYHFVNDLRTYSYITIICTSSLAIIASSDNIKDQQKGIYVAILISFNVLFYAIWLFYFIKKGADWENSKSLVADYFRRVSDRLSKRFSKLK